MFLRHSLFFFFFNTGSSLIWNFSSKAGWLTMEPSNLLMSVSQTQGLQGYSILGIGATSLHYLNHFFLMWVLGPHA